MNKIKAESMGLKIKGRDQGVKSKLKIKGWNQSVEWGDLVQKAKALIIG